jgi:secreted Zn-dependent insulinase-like peptidase
MEVEGEDAEAEDEGEEEGGDEEEDEEEEESAPAAAGASSDIPTPIYGKSALTWHKQDHATWCMPKVNVFVSIENHLATICANNIVMTDLLAHMLKELMNEYSYYADCAGIYKNIQLSRQGIQSTFQGYGHKLPVLIQRTMEVLYHINESADTTPASTLPRLRNNYLPSRKKN